MEKSEINFFIGSIENEILFESLIITDITINFHFLHFIINNKEENDKILYNLFI